ncbi:hypothetical protein ES707_03436 [subsurface metagenome]
MYLRWSFQGKNITDNVPILNNNPAVTHNIEVEHNVIHSIWQRVIALEGRIKFLDSEYLTLHREWSFIRAHFPVKVANSTGYGSLYSGKVPPICSSGILEIDACFWFVNAIKSVVDPVVFGWH